MRSALSSNIKKSTSADTAKTKPIPDEELVAFKMPRKRPLPKFGKSSKAEVKRQLAEYEAFLDQQRKVMKDLPVVDAVKLVREQRDKGY